VTVTDEIELMTHHIVMAGLVPAIHVLLAERR